MSSLVLNPLTGQLDLVNDADGSGITQLTGDVTAGPSTGSTAAAVALVGGSTAANVHAAEVLANAATSANTVSAIVRRDGSGNFTAGTITAALTGTASGNTTITPNNHGIVASGSGNVLSVISPNASTALPLISGGSSANPSWAVLSEAGGGTNQSTYTTGDVLYASASNTLSKLPVGSSGQSLRISSSNVPFWSDFNDQSRYVTLYEDFLVPTTLTVLGSGAGSIVGLRGAAGTAAHPGAIRLATGSTTTGNANLLTTNADDILKIGGSGAVTFETIVNLSALSDNTDTYTVQIGLTNLSYNSTLTIPHGIFFTYTNGTNSGKWLLNCIKNSSSTTSDTGVAAVADWQKIGFVLNAAGTSVQAFINGVSAGSPIITNIPLSTTALNLQWFIIKSAGTTTRILDVDAYKLSIILGTAR